MGLIAYFSKNKHLSFLNAKTAERYSLDDMLHNLPGADQTESKKLVFLYLDDSLLSISIYLSFLNSSHTLALLNTVLGADFKEKLENIYKPTLVVDKERTAIEGMSINSVQTKLGTYAIFKRGDSDNTRLHQNCKVLLSTSGSTGSPKFVKLSEENLLQNALSIADYLPINKDDVSPINLPIYYSYGLSVLHSNAIAGGTIVCDLGDIIQRAFWSDCEKYGFTSIAGVPFIYEMLDRIGFRKKSHPSLKYMSQAGGNLNLKTKEKFADYCEDNGIDLYIMYGQTEATARISYVPPKMLRDKMSSIGIPIKNGTLQLDPENDELLYAGPNVFGGYANEANDLLEWDPEQHLRTGDLARKDEDGYFFITGRMKRFVKLYGNRINLDELERYLKNTLENTSLATNGIADKILLISYADTDLDEAGVKKEIFEKI